jgi:hypothetical protein
MVGLKKNTEPSEHSKRSPFEYKWENFPICARNIPFQIHSTKEHKKNFNTVFPVKVSCFFCNALLEKCALGPALYQWFSTVVRPRPGNFFFLQDKGPAVERHCSICPELEMLSVQDNLFSIHTPRQTNSGILISLWSTYLGEHGLRGGVLQSRGGFLIAVHRLWAGVHGGAGPRSRPLLVVTRRGTPARAAKGSTRFLK